jgi:threonine/homoserine/homoserine lactone efflux protein
LIDPTHPLVTLVASSMTLATAANAAAHALLASRLLVTVSRPGVRRAINRAGGAMLVGAGTAVTLRRAA